jgi:uncharacterized membrane protein
MDEKTKENELIEQQSRDEKSNSIAKILNFIGWLIAALSIIIGLLMSGTSNFTATITTIVTGVVSGLIFIGFSEVIDLLHKIYLNTKK